MVECRYCGEVFDDEDAYVDHLANRHEGELSAIDERRIASHKGSERSLPITASTAGAVIAVVVLAGLVIWGVMALTGGNAEPVEGVAVTPTELGSVHFHGTMEMRVLGDPVDFSQPEYQLQADPFHFENRNGERWHGHAREVTLEYAMETLGIEVNASAVTYDGQTYRNSSAEYVVLIRVNGEPVDPRSYRLEQGDAVRIIVRNQSSSAEIPPVEVWE